MTQFAYHYRVTIYDSTGATPLTPIGGAAHSDSFQVTTQTGVVGWKSYLVDSFPQGRRGTIDRLPGRYSIGELTVRILDAKVSTDNLTRWVTAFFGDAYGRLQFKDKKIKVEEYDGSTWSDYFTGRVYKVLAPNPAAKDQGPVIDFVIREEMTQAKRLVFTGVPHSSVTYAKASPLFPIGDGFNTTPVAKGVVYQTDAGYGIMLTGNDYVGFSRDNRSRLTKAFASRADGGQVRIHMTRNDTSASGDFLISRVGVPIRNTPTGRRTTNSIGFDGASPSDKDGSMIWLDAGQWKGYVSALGITAIPNNAYTSTSPAAHPFKYMAMPAAGTEVTFYAYNSGAPAEDCALLIGPVHPATLINDLAAGYFSTLNSTTGVVDTTAIPVDATSVSNLVADGTLGTVRFVIDRPWKFEDFLIEQLTRITHIAGRTKGDGKLYLKDLRLTATTGTGLGTITGADVETGDWDQGQDAVGAITVNLYSEKSVKKEEWTGGDEDILEIPAHGIRQNVASAVFATPLFADATAQKITLDARGLKFTPGPYNSSDMAANDQLWRAFAYSAASPIDQLFGTSAAYYSGSFRRNSNTDLWPGDWTLVNADEIPNSASNVRGGVRLFMCLERSDEGVRRRMRFLDAGPNSVSTVPTVGTPTLNATTPKHACDVAITVNASTEPVILQEALTTTAVGTRPAATSALWVTRTSKITASGSVTVDRLPSGNRVWVRALTQTQNKLPSSYAHPAGTGYVDLTALTAPNTVVATASGTSLILTWINGETDYGIMPTINGVNALSTPLPAGSTRYVFDELTASTSYTVGVKHVDPYGGESSLVTATQSTSTASTLNAPRGLQILQGRGSSSRASIPPSGVTIGYGYEIKFRVTEPSAYTRIDVSQSGVFATIEMSIDLAPGVEKTFLFVAQDSNLRYIRATHIRTSFTTSAASSTVSAYPTALLPQAQSDAFAGGSAMLSVESSGTLKLNVDASDDLDTDRFYYETARNSSSYPAVTVGVSPSIARSAMPYFATVTIGASSLLGGDEVKLHGYFYNDVTGIGQEVRHSIRANAVKVPTAKWSTLTQSGSTGTATLTVDDPDLCVTTLEFRTKIGSAAFSAYVNTWDSSTGTAGTNTSLVRTESLSIGSKHGSVIQAQVTYSIGGTSQSYTLEHYFDIDEIANVTSVSISFDGSNNIVVTAIGDEDTANIYVTANGSGSTPSDPTSGANDGTIAARSGTVATSVTCAAGNTAKVKARGYNSGASAGTVFGPVSQVNNGSVGAAYDIINVYITAAVDTAPTPDQCKPEVTYSVVMPSGYTLDLDYITTDSQSVENVLNVATGETTTSRTSYTSYGNCGYYYNKPTYTDWVTVVLRVTMKTGGGTTVKVGYSNAITYNYVLAI